MTKYWTILLLLAAPTCSSFVVPWRPATTTTTSLYADNLDDMRNMLQSSWDVESMGQVPSTPELAAEEAAASIQKAANAGLGNVCFVDLLLPQYDIQQGSNIYDEVEAVDFCRLISKCLNTQAVIYVQNEKSLKTVTKVLDARESARDDDDEQVAKEDEYEYDEVEVVIDENDEAWDDYADDDDDDDMPTPEPEKEAEIFDDFSDFDSAEGSSFFSTDPSSVPPNPSTSDSDDFRQQLSSSWTGDDEPKPEKQKRTKVVKKLIKRKIEKLDDTATRQAPRNYRLASLFGDKTISRGLEMSNDVVKAVKAHGLPKKEEETMILLSANSEAEMLAVRALVSKYVKTKKIIMVNCRLDPLPPELESCSTVYHLTPLIATTALDERNIFGKEKEEEKSPIKVVSIRRYPGEWEVYVDADGKGFELAQRSAANKFQNKGPSFDWIGGVIKDFLSARS